MGAEEVLSNFLFSGEMVQLALFYNDDIGFLIIFAF